MFDLQEILNQIAQLQRDIECVKNGDCCKPICDIREEEGTLIFELCNGTEFTIAFPAGKYVTAINPVVGDDIQWELVYNDATTAIIDAPYYIVNQGAGEEIIFNQAGHPTSARTLNENDANSKILVETSGDEIVFKVKQYGLRYALDFEDNTGVSNYLPVIDTNIRYQNPAGNTSIVTKTAAGSKIANPLTDYISLNLEVLDSYKSKLNFNIKHTFDLTYSDVSYQDSTDKKFFFCFAMLLGGGTPSIPNGLYWEQTNNDYFNNNLTTVFYDMYVNETDDVDNKHRRFAESKVCEAYYQKTDGTAEPETGWYDSGVVGPYIVFRYPWVNGLTDPLGGGDPTLSITFECKGSIIVPTTVSISDTDFLSGVASQLQNH